MLSRAASNIFWLARYIERAENTASILKANIEFLMDSETGENPETSKTWVAVMKTLDVDKVYIELAAKQPGLTPLSFLTASPKNPDSLYNCIAQARENARMVRDQISEKMWLEVNSIYHKIKAEIDDLSWHKDPSALFDRISRFSFLFQGITNATITYGEGHAFYQLGKYLERGDKTSRILDLPHYGGDVSGQNQWSEVLNASGGRGAYIAEYGVVPKAENVTNFLIFSEDFPRSLRFCFYRVSKMLATISRSKVRKRYSNEAERLAGAGLATIDFTGEEILEEGGLHEFLDDMQGRFNAIGQKIFEIYFLIKFESEIDHILPNKAEATGSLQQSQTQS